MTLCVPAGRSLSSRSGASHSAPVLRCVVVFSLMEVVFIRFCITPVNLRFKPTKVMIVTDDYSDSEIGQKRHLRHIKEDINNTPDWNSNFAYIYNANNLKFLERISLTN